MLRRSVAALAACLVLCAAPVQAGFVVEGFTYSRLAPPLPGGDFGVAQALNPLTGDVWATDGVMLYKVRTNEWASSEPLRSGEGGPLQGNWTTSNIAFDPQGRLYIANAGTGEIYRRTGDSDPWELWIDVFNFPRWMQFDSAGNLVVLGGNGTPTAPATVISVDATGAVTQLGVTPQGRTFTFAADGSLIIPVVFGGGINRFNLDGSTDEVFRYDGYDGEWASIAVTTGGNYIVGIVDDYNWEESRNTSRIIRVNGVTGQRELLAVDLDYSIPMQLYFADGDLAIVGYGSLHTGVATGDFDGPLIPLQAVPEPSTFALAAIAIGAFFLRRKRFGQGV